MTGAALGDRFGRRRMFIAGLALFTLASAAAAVAPSTATLVGARAFQGAGAAIVTPLTLTLLSEAFPSEKRGLAIGAWSGISGLGVALGPVVGGAVIDGISWHWIFWINVPIGLVILPLAALRLKESRGAARRLDLPGVAIASAGLFALAAAALWGGATVFGRYALASVRFTTLTALRFVTALPALLIVLLLIGGPAAFGNYRWGDTPLYLAIALVPGLFPMLLYYRGLASTPASLATLAELAFPITGILVNLYFVTPPQTITAWQLVGIVVLVGALVALDYTNARRPAKLERGAEVALT